MINAIFRIVITSWEEGKECDCGGIHKGFRWSPNALFLKWKSRYLSFTYLYTILGVSLKYLVTQWEWEPVLSYSQVTWARQGKQSVSPNTAARGGSVALRLGHLGESNEPAVSLRLLMGATFHSEVSKERGNKYQHNGAVEVIWGESSRWLAWSFPDDPSSLSNWPV